MTLSFLIGYHTIGKAGRPNEDRFRILGCDRIFPDDRQGPYLKQGKGAVFGVFDGVGGSERPIAAAQQAADALVSIYTDQHPISPTIIAKRLANANKAIHQWGFIENTDRPLGACTATVCWLYRDCAHLFHAGDSAAYHWNDHQRTLTLMTHDHTDHGSLVRYLGLGEDLLLEQRTFKITCGDLLILCTDGLTKGLRKDEMVPIIHQHLGQPGDLAQALAQTAQRRKVQDDITVLVAEIE
jgi:serine/threonine protein phosphatase PrpC